VALGSVGEIHIRGLAELQRDLQKVNRGAAKAVRDELKQVAEPVAWKAESLALSEISHIGPAWSRMRVGIRRASVYVAPRSRRHGGSPRPNLGILLMTESLIPAVEQSEHQILRGVERALDHLLESVDL